MEPCGHSFLISLTSDLLAFWYAVYPQSMNIIVLWNTCPMQKHSGVPKMILRILQLLNHTFKTCGGIVADGEDEFPKGQ